jgi:hypothetical protein
VSDQFRVRLDFKHTSRACVGSSTSMSVHQRLSDSVALILTLGLDVTSKRPDMQL